MQGGENEGNLAHERQQCVVAAADALHHFVEQGAHHSKLREQLAHLRLCEGTGEGTAGNTDAPASPPLHGGI